MTGCACTDEVAGLERRTLKILLAVNATMFVAEMVVGWVAESTALIADSVDMLAGAAVYGVSLYAVGRPRSLQASAANMSGFLQIGLGIGVLVEVVRRAIFVSEPMSSLMITAGFIALIANVIL